jgi:hypothetical protein
MLKIIDNNSDPIFTVDENGNITYLQDNKASLPKDKIDNIWEEVEKLFDIKDLEKTHLEIHKDHKPVNMGTLKTEELDIYLVDGNKVEVDEDMDFVEGGNFKKWKFIPKGQVWIDAWQYPEMDCFIAFHEVIETLLMKEGMSYNKAHPIANKYEKEKRKDFLKEKE